MPKSMFKKQLLASSVAMVVASGAIAQTNEAIQEEELVVTGIRASLQRAMDIKRDAQGVVDAISAEDIGKFPDTNLAESLQRITGISIDRSNGEGALISARGLGPDYNLVMLNGRQMPGAAINDTSASGSRSFNFANIASEGISAVEVYKTVRAKNTPGGIGATINVKTARPLDKPGLQANVKVAGTWDDSSEDPSVTPRISGLISQTFADDTIGIQLSAAYQDREGGQRIASVGTGWRTFNGTTDNDWGTPDTAWGAVPANDGANNINRPEGADIYGVPQQVGYAWDEFSRERINGQLVFQVAPSDDLTVTLDFTYSSLEDETIHRDTGAWFNFGGHRTLWTDTDGDAAGGGNESPLVYGEVGSGAGDLTFGYGLNSVRNMNQSGGLNVEWQATEKLSYSFDFHHSTARSGPNNPYGNSTGISISNFMRDKTFAFFGGGSGPVIAVGANAGSAGPMDPSTMQYSGSFFRKSNMIHEINQFQLDSEYEFSDNGSINFGVSYVDASNSSTFANNQRDTWSGIGAPGQVSDFTVEDVLGRFDDLDTGYAEGIIANNPFSANTMDGVALLNQFPEATLQDHLNYIAANGLDDGKGTGTCASGLTWYCAPDIIEDETQIFEESTSAYVQWNMSAESDYVTTDISVGVRYEKTDVANRTTPITSKYDNGSGQIDIFWQANNEVYIAPGANADQDIVEESGGYDYFLPSIDIAMTFMEDFTARASWGRSLARPGWNTLGGLQVGRRLGPQQGSGGGSEGDVNLKPISAYNFDLSLEWYYGDTSYVSMGYFNKNIEDFIGANVGEPRDIFGELGYSAPHPAYGTRRDDCAASGVDVNNDAAGYRQCLITNLDPQFVDSTSSPERIYGDASDSPNATFLITSFVNERDIAYDGWEFQVQHAFGDTGFGGIVNYTIVDSDAEFKDDAIGIPQFAVSGQSDTFNIVAYYENFGFQTRLAYNWRDEFIFSTASGTGDNPQYTKARGQLDWSGSYDINENFTVFADAINLTNEPVENRGRTDQQVLSYIEQGVRFNIGASYKF